MEYDPDDSLFRTIRKGRRVLNKTFDRFRISPEMSIDVNWQGFEELKEISTQGTSDIPILEEFVSFTFNTSLIYSNLKDIQRKGIHETAQIHLLQQEMRTAQVRNLLIDTFYDCATWELQTEFFTSDKVTVLTEALTGLYENMLDAVECVELKGEEASFREDCEQLDLARTRFESTLIELGFSGAPIPKRSLLQRILKRFQS